MYDSVENSRADLQAAEKWPQPDPSRSPVSVFTEWDPLEEVIVGIIDDIRVPDWDPNLNAVIPEKAASFFRALPDRFPSDLVALAKREVDQLASLLSSEGVVVRRPDEFNHRKTISTPYFSTNGGFYSAMPRDCLFSMGNTIIEAPMAWRSRYFETFAFRSILQDYFDRGAHWISAPKPMLKDDLWNLSHEKSFFDSVIRDDEPLFDAADFVRLGRDIIGQRSHVTNRKGVDWLRMALGPEFTVHVFSFDDASPMHIDTTILPLAPGKVLVNRAWVSRLPDIFRHWDVLTPPASTLPDSHPLYMTSKWIHSNVLMLDEKRVIVEAQEEHLIASFTRWGFTPIPCSFRHFQSLGGSFHCATLDVRRRGRLDNYL
ncbi:amidinotransferase [Trinickia sp.]|uniref:amidinotransferase n=1 Tax=Trinickia sp. TaxID=2571163 RepID=UPI003F822866